jgi:hypothetical protein
MGLCAITHTLLFYVFYHIGCTTQKTFGDCLRGEGGSKSHQNTPPLAACLASWGVWTPPSAALSRPFGLLGGQDLAPAAYLTFGGGLELPPSRRDMTASPRGGNLRNSEKVYVHVFV